MVSVDYVNMKYIKNGRKIQDHPIFLNHFDKSLFHTEKVSTDNMLIVIYHFSAHPAARPRHIQPAIENDMLA